MRFDVSWASNPGISLAPTMPPIMHSSKFATSHLIMSSILHTTKGIFQKNTLRYYYAVAEQRHNHYTHSDTGITPFEIVTGETPRTPHNFMAIPTNADITALGLAPIDRAFIELLKENIRNTIVWLHFKDEDRLHKEKAHRLTDLYNRRTKIYEHRVNDIVSYGGQSATIVALLQPTVTGPAKARIQFTNHDNSTEKVVMYVDLFPIGIAYPELMIDTAIIDIVEGAFCFYQMTSSDTTMIIVPGLIIAVDFPNQVCTIHRYEQVTRPKNKFIPIWTPIKTLTTPSGRKLPRTSKLKNQTPEYLMVSYKDIILTTQLDANGRLDDAILRSLANQGIMPCIWMRL